jgi:hypothetical protein
VTDTAELDRFFPPRGPCLICGTPGLGARHRVIEAVADAVLAGDDPKDVEQDYMLAPGAALVAVEWAQHMDGLG